MLSQIPPQKIYATVSCNAALPDYKLKITASDNCEIATFVQTPAPGYLLTSANKVATVVVKATDASGNFQQVSFTVTLLDTIKPKLTIDPTLLSYQMQQVKDIYNFGDRLIFGQEQNFYAQAWIDSVPGLRTALEDSSYFKKTMHTWTPRGCFTLNPSDSLASRWFTFYDPDIDTVLIPRIKF
jgi:hypothetical protein